MYAILGKYLASGPPNTAPELPETPWYCRGTAGVLPGYCRGAAGVLPALKIDAKRMEIIEKH